MVQRNLQNTNSHFIVNSGEKPNNTVQFRKSYLTYLKYLRKNLLVIYINKSLVRMSHFFA